MPERDVPSDLHALWQQLPSSSGVKDLHEEDSRTQEAVAWMSQAWTCMPIPSVSAPPRKLRPSRFVLATAAALLFGALLFLTDPTTEQQPDATTTLIAAAPQTPISPRLIETSVQRTQVLSGKVRLTMLHSQGPPTSTPKTEF